MTVDCKNLVHARGTLAPLECRTLIDPVPRDFVLTDVVFELDDHPNGFQSRACGHVWNALPGQWSRMLVGGHVDDRGRRYNLTTGLVCPKGSRLSVCTCWFPSQPTSRLWAVLSGYYCEDAGFDLQDLVTGTLAGIDWLDMQPAPTIGGVDPVGEATMAQDLEGGLVTRTLLGTVRDRTEGRDFQVSAADGKVGVGRGETAALRVSGPEVTWTAGGREGRTRLPEGTTMVLVRRAADGSSIHWVCYAETREDERQVG